MPRLRGLQRAKYWPLGCLWIASVHSAYRVESYRTCSEEDCRSATPGPVDGPTVNARRPGKNLPFAVLAAYEVLDSGFDQDLEIADGPVHPTSSCTALHFPSPR